MTSTLHAFFLHGEDEVGIAEFIEGKRKELGEPTVVDLNFVRLAGRVELGPLKNAVSAVPFLASKRVVVLDGALGTMRSKADQDGFLALVEGLPQTTDLVVIERSVLKDTHWLLKWTGNHQETWKVEKKTPPTGAALVQRVQDYARQRGGAIGGKAARHLTGLVGEDSQMALTEVDKLLNYVNRAREIDVDDVDLLTAPMQQAGVFDMVDAIGARNGRLALSLLNQLLAEDDPGRLFGMIVRQFRLILIAKELTDQRIPMSAWKNYLITSDFVGAKMTAQARNFDLARLEMIYRKLDEIDDRLKTGKIDSLDAALEAFVAEVTARG